VVSHQRKCLHPLLTAKRELWIRRVVTFHRANKNLLINLCWRNSEIK